MKGPYWLYLLITVCAMVLAYQVGARQHGIAQEAARCLKLPLPEQDKCLDELAASVEKLSTALNALAEQKRE